MYTVLFNNSGLRKVKHQGELGWILDQSIYDLWTKWYRDRFFLVRGFFPVSIFPSKLHTHYHHHHHLNINIIRRTNGTLISKALSEIVEHSVEKYIHFNHKYGDRMFFLNVAKTHFYIKSNPRNKFSNKSNDYLILVTINIFWNCG
jgi:hypothetical protein